MAHYLTKTLIYIHLEIEPICGDNDDVQFGLLEI